MMEPAQVNYPLCPDAPPGVGRFSRLANRVLPNFFRARWKLDEFFACELDGYEPVAERQDVTIDWVENGGQLTREHRDFLRGQVGRPVAMLWQHRLKTGCYVLAMARWQGRIAHFTFATLGGGSAKPYRPVVKEPNLVGPSYTSPEARGNGILSYVISRALARLKAAGRHWAYVATSPSNTASLRGIRKDPAWVHVGRLLFSRRVFGRYRLRAVTIARADLTCLGPQSQNAD